MSNTNENARGRSRSPNRFNSGGGGGREPPAPRPGDWTCPSCNANVFASNQACFRCKAPRTPNARVYGQEPSHGSGMGHEFRRDGDWTCPSCSTNCFASKNECFKCKTPKPSGNMEAPRPGAGGMGGGPGGNRTFTPREGDWTCPECGGNCFASRMECFRCKAPRPTGA
ncbi:hypothetical protein T484DRAFT_1620517 [Baffinella frigidus]|nr:hypothetical protein T484DRAFT_1620517 [Cryptophyta sp. CCMP2293]